MDPAPPIAIHEVIPTEILAIIFEEHAELEWRAPAIDGQVCRIWRRVVLNTPRAWVHLKICDDYHPSIEELRLWLHRSGTAPLHIDIHVITGIGWYDLFSDHHTRIASLRMLCGGDPSFFNERDFPCLQLLHVKRWYPKHPPSFPPQCVSMPKLQSLRLGTTGWPAVPSDMLASLKLLMLYNNHLVSLSPCSQSLTRLMLVDVSLGDGILGPMAFPSLNYLSLYKVRGLKPRMDAPCLVTYHEGGCMLEESFDTPLPSLVEYGVCGLPASYSDPATWHLSFPNITRLALRARQPVLLSFLDSLAHQPHSLPALQVVSAGNSFEHVKIAEDIQKMMKNLIMVRSEACHKNVVLWVENGPPIFQIPIFFGNVGSPPIRQTCVLLTHILGTGMSLLIAESSPIHMYPAH